jgi:hypothetical protein
MAIQDIIQDHFVAADQTTFNTHMAALELALQARLRNLSVAENHKYGRIKDKHKMLVNSVDQYRDNQPALSSGDVDWTEFKADKFDREFLETSAARLMALANAMLETKRLHDFDNYSNALIDYDHTKSKARTAPGMGYDTKAAALKPLI